MFARRGGGQCGSSFVRGSRRMAGDEQQMSRAASDERGRHLATERARRAGDEVRRGGLESIARDALDGSVLHDDDLADMTCIRHVTKSVGRRRE